jgi:NAD(P)-dependent dehydrogenase (short-subunit alcohol dehydrogenase family)
MKQEINEMKLQNKVAIVTGAAMGIGKGIASILGREGARLVLADVNVPEGLKTCSELEKLGYEAFFVECDVSREDQVIAMINASVERLCSVFLIVTQIQLSSGKRSSSGKF